MNQLIRSDSVKVAAQLAAESVDLTVTSPPFDNLFGLGEFDFDGLAEQLWRITKPGGVVAWNVQDRIVKGGQSCSSCVQQLKFREIGFRLHETLISFSKGSNQPWANGRYPRVWQYVFIYSKGKPKTFRPIKDKPNITVGSPVKYSTRDPKTGKRKNGRSDHRVAPFGVRTNVWEYKVGSNQTTNDRYAFDHPALMPEKLVEDLILSYSNPYDLVFDPFLGAATTTKMALLNYRQYLGVEINRQFYRLAKRRMVDAEKLLRERLDQWLAA